MNPYVVPGISKQKRKPITKVVAEFFGIPEDNMKQKCRKREIVLPRQVCMFCLINYSDKHWSDTGLIFVKDRSTVYHSVKAIRNLIETDRFFSNKMVELEKALEHNGYARKN
jgi:chromosomal replication initiator protein